MVVKLGDRFRSGEAAVDRLRSCDRQYLSRHRRFERSHARQADSPTSQSPPASTLHSELNAGFGLASPTARPNSGCLSDYFPLSASSSISPSKCSSLGDTDA
ncbi:hypothetical protein RB4492 [Rhodopirellula baltica SH 1]|uniref:Uncharacterized protein n=1 Tax=Rhodopirellula baltica (strain DSM 10527 / NCIMB 13988 / SH1) TaxID=243090 RepID=Q7USH7_RHOBA|nr:hypothetical protein RB4492 [Rhodopirellula baltica SH 1]